MTFASRLAACALASSLFAAPAFAATVTRNFEVTLTGFVDVMTDQPAPLDPLFATFTVTYDTETAVENTTVGLAVAGVNAPYDGYLAFSYIPHYNPGSNLFRLGAITGVGDTVSGFSDDTNDFGLSFLEASSGGALGGASGAYRLAGDNAAFWIALEGSVVETTPTATVPEPATWALMIAGFGACGGALRRSARRTRA